MYGLVFFLKKIGVFRVRLRVDFFVIIHLYKSKRTEWNCLEFDLVLWGIVPNDVMLVV